MPGTLNRVKLRTRVLMGVMTVTLIALAGSGYAAASAVHRYLLTQTDSDLRAVLDEYRTVIVSSGGLPSDSKAKTLPSHGPPGKSSSSEAFQVPALLDTYYVGVTGTNHRATIELAGGNNDLVPSLREVLAAGTYTVTSANGQIQLRVMAEPVGHIGMLVVTTSLTGLDSTASRLQLIVIISSLAAAAVVVTGVGFVVRRGLRPVEMMAAAADKITAGDLTSRVRPDDPVTEVGRLGAALNGMLTRIEATVRQQEASEEATRRFFADASHELRTPLASLRANAELYRQGALTRHSQVDEAMRRITVEARRMGGLVDDMLRLARLDQHPQLDRKPVDLSSLAAECVERASIASPSYTWDARMAPGLVTTGDEELLRRAIDNMLANVAAHTPPGTSAVLTAAAQPGRISIEVSDDGPGIASSELTSIFGRFYRARSQTPRPGSGLGLAIVAAAAAAHGGTARAALNLPSGLRVTLTVTALCYWQVFIWEDDPMPTTLDWRPDPLEGYQQHVFELGRDPDGEGEIAAVLVRRQPLDSETARGAVLYVHGFSDYFFQTELADFFAARGVAFYALDLRKCGRARRPGQTAHYVSDLAYYDDELDLALTAITEAHPGAPVLLAAHSTGGLIVPLWVNRRHPEQVTGLVLNSPWFDLQVHPAARRAVLTQALRVMAKITPFHALKPEPGVYGSTLHTSGTGEWEFDVELKPLAGFPVTYGWLNAIRRGHARLHRGLDVGVPSLVLRSDRTHFSRQYSDLSDHADLVLDVEQIGRWPGSLGGENTTVVIDGGRHDIFLSLPEIRARAYAAVGEWLDQHPEVTGTGTAVAST